ncbi:MAG: prepilin peptidase, partial [Acidiferrobacterales bacterium]
MSWLKPWLDSNLVFLLFTAGILGLVVGSFLNVVIHRLPLMLEHAWRRQCDELLGEHEANDVPEEKFNLVTPASHCPRCGHAISALQNIPIISFVLLKGKCAACGQAISWRYPVVELVSGILSVVVVWHFGATSASVAALIFTWS